MQTALKIFVGVAILFLLIAIRVKESVLFYDPLIIFFKSGHGSQSLPDMDFIRLIANTALRFFMNTLLSLVLLWVFYKRKSVVIVSSVIYGVLFVLLYSIFCIIITQDSLPPHHFLFYTRRFLIQPILVLVLVPAFYFQLKKN